MRTAETHLRSSGGILMLCLRTISETARGTIRFRELVELTSEQVVTLGARSLPLIATSAIATGAVMALQFGAGLTRFGGRLYVPQIVALSILRELGPVLCGLLLAGRVGSGITAELASMNVTEQIDAVRALGNSPLTSLALPRILACIIVFPSLVLFTDYVAIFSAMIVSAWSNLAIDPTLYIHKTLNIMIAPDVWTGAVKGAVFGLYVGTVACWKAFNTSGGTQGVGLSTNWIVVRTSIFILVSDFFLTRLFLYTVY